MLALRKDILYILVTYYSLLVTRYWCYVLLVTRYSFRMSASYLYADIVYI